MADRSMRFCAHAGCAVLVSKERYCDTHATLHALEQNSVRDQNDKKRKNAHDRGYNYRWSKYSKWYLRQPQHQFCALHLDDGCATVAQCVDHIQPPSGPSDPLFWDKGNHQPSCIYCNSKKGNKKLRGGYVFAGQRASAKDDR